MDAQKYAEQKEKIITRIFSVKDFRAAPTIGATDDPKDGESIITGHAAIFDTPTNIGNYFTEQIARGAFDGCNFDDVLFFINHQQNKIALARSRRNNGNSTMQLNVDNIGLNMSARVDIENNYESKALVSAISRGDISGMSFCFRVSEDDWKDLDTDMPTRTIIKIAQVYEVSAVNEPAYDDTDISARDKMALDNAKAILDNVARSQGELDNSKAEIELLKIKNAILASY